MSFASSTRLNQQSTVVPLATVVSGSVVGGPAFFPTQHDVAPDSLMANVSAAITTNLLTVNTKWQVSDDNGVTWKDLKGLNSAATVQVPAAGTGALVTTAYAQACQADVAHGAIRLAIVTGGATGAAGDNITISYNYRRRGY